MPAPAPGSNARPAPAPAPWSSGRTRAPRGARPTSAQVGPALPRRPDAGAATALGPATFDDAAAHAAPAPLARVPITVAAAATDAGTARPRPRPPAPARRPLRARPEVLGLLIGAVVAACSGPRGREGGACADDPRGVGCQAARAPRAAAAPSLGAIAGALSAPAPGPARPHLADARGSTSATTAAPDEREPPTPRECRRVEAACATDPRPVRRCRRMVDLLRADGAGTTSLASCYARATSCPALEACTSDAWLARR